MRASVDSTNCLCASAMAWCKGSLTPGINYMIPGRHSIPEMHRCRPGLISGVKPISVSEPARPGKSIMVWNGRRCTESLAADRPSFGPMQPIRDSLNYDRRLLSVDETVSDEPKMRRAT